MAFTIDIRDVDPQGLVIRDMARQYAVDFSCTQLAASEVIHLSAPVIAALEAAAMKMGIRCRRMNSGAVHDSAMLAQITDVGMIFVPSVGSRSHVPEERTRYEEINIGCDLLVQTILTLAQ